MVTRTVKLNILTRQDLKDLENNVMELEKLAQRAATAKQRIGRSGGGGTAKSRFGTAKGKKTLPTSFLRKLQKNKSSLLVDEFQLPPTKQKGVKGIASTRFGSEEGAQALPSAILKKRQKAEIGRAAESSLLARQKGGKKSGAGPLSAFKSDTKFQKDFDKLQKGLAETRQKVLEIDKITSDPISFLTGILGKNKAVAKVFAGAFIGQLIVALTLTKVKEFFAEGGPGDIRKKVLDVVRSIPELAFLLEVREGKSFLTSDKRVRSQVAQNSATQSMGNREILYTQLNIGSGLLD